MLFTSIMSGYFRWHYTKAFVELYLVWLNFLWFVVHFFSIPQLLTSLIAPWRRMIEQRTKGGDFEDFAGYIIINLLSRVVGAIMRSIVIICGLLCLTIVIVLGGTTLLLWVFMPALAVGSILTGIALLITTVTTI